MNEEKKTNASYEGKISDEKMKNVTGGKTTDRSGNSPRIAGLYNSQPDDGAKEQFERKDKEPKSIQDT